MSGSYSRRVLIYVRKYGTLPQLVCLLWSRLGFATITFEVFDLTGVSTILFEFSCTLPFNFSCTSTGFDNVSLLFSLPSSDDKALYVCWWSGVNKTDAPGVLFCFAIESAFCSLGEKDTPRSPEIFPFL